MISFNSVNYMQHLIAKVKIRRKSCLLLALIFLCISAAQSQTSNCNSCFFEGEAGTTYHAEASGNIKIGFGATDITPDWPVLLAYGRQEPTDKYFDKTKVKVIFMSVDDVQLAWLVFDFIGVNKEKSYLLKKEIGRATGIDPRHLILSGTHNHSYPHINRMPDRLFKFITDKAISAVKEAQNSQFDARIGFGKTHTRGDLNLNRAEVYGMVNTRLYTTRIEDKDGHLRGVQYNYGSHPVKFTDWGSTLGQIGPNFPGYVNRFVEDRIRLDLLFKNYDDKLGIDTDPFVMYSHGAAGDQEPSRRIYPLYDRSKPGMQVFMEELGKEVLRAIDHVETRSEVDLRFSSKVVELTQRSGEPYLTLLQALVINDAVIFTMPGEFEGSLGFKMEELSPFENTMSVSVTNDYLGYIVREELAHELVTYQSKRERFTPDFSRTLVSEAIGLVVSDFNANDERLDSPEATASIAGHVQYDGEQAVAVGVKRRPRRPSYSDSFFGKRTVVNPDGSWKIENLAPGTFYLYLVEADADSPAPESQRSDHTDIRDIFYGYPVTLQKGESKRNINFSVAAKEPSHSISGFELVTESLDVDGSAVSGRFIAHKEGFSESDGTRVTTSFPAGTEVRAFPAGHPYNWEEIFLKNPVQSAHVNENGTFFMTGLTPGDYQIVCYYDANHNQLVEPRIDVLSSYVNSPIIRIKKDGNSRIIQVN